MASSNPNYTAPPFTTDGFNLASSQGKGPDIRRTKLNPSNTELTPPPNTSANIMEKIKHLSNRLSFLTTHNTEFRENVAMRLENLKVKIRQVKDAIKILPGPNTPPTEEVNKLKQQLALAQTAVQKLTNERATTEQERDKAKKDLQDANAAMTNLVSEIDKYVGLDFNNLNDVLQLVTEIEQGIDSVENEIRNRGGSGSSGGGGSSGGVPASGGGRRVAPSNVPAPGGRVPGTLPPPPGASRPVNPNRARLQAVASSAGRMGTAANAFRGAASIPTVPRPPPAATATAGSGSVPPPIGTTTNPLLGARTGGKSKKLRKKQKKKSKTKRRKH